MGASGKEVADSLGLFCGAAVAAGLASYVVYFHRSEHHMNGMMYLGLFLASSAAITGYFISACNIPIGPAIVMTTSIASSYLTGAIGSMMVWRIFFNPLNKFPGPWGARLGNLYMSYVFRNSDAYYKLTDLHRKYGKIVRVGSNDLSIIEPTIMEDAYGRDSKVTKSHWYDNDAPLTSMHTTRDRKVHDARRKVWSPAFSEKAIRDYETRIQGFEEKVVEKFGAANGKPVDVRTWFNLFSFDAMALLAFGKNYDMLEHGEKHWALDLLDEGMQPLAYFFPSWFFKMMTQIPGAGAGYKKFVKFCVDELSWRVRNAQTAEEKGGNDIMSWILRAYKGIDRPERDTLLQADARLIIVAGSDTTATTFTYLFYQLASNPEAIKKLRDEIRPLTRGDWSEIDIRQAQYLNGCINEALRMNPPVPSGVSRLSPPEGLKVGDQWVPGHTIFYMPQYVMGHGKYLSIETALYFPMPSS